MMSLNDCIQILFHPIHRHLILIVYPREILIFDLQILQTVGNISCEKTSAAFYKVFLLFFFAVRTLISLRRLDLRVFATRPVDLFPRKRNDHHPKPSDRTHDRHRSAIDEM